MGDIVGIMEEWLRLIEELRGEVAQLRAENAALKVRVAELESENAELRLELQRRKKGFRPQANASTRAKSTQDRRAVGERKHPGTTRPEPPIDESTVVHHEVVADVCPECRGSLIKTGEFIDKTSRIFPSRRSKCIVIGGMCISVRVV